MSRLWKSWESLSKGAKWGWAVIVIVTVLFVLPVTCEVGRAFIFGGPGTNDSGWTIESEKAFLQGCTLFGTADSESTRICACLLVDMKRAGRSPADAAEMSEAALHQRPLASWVRPIVEGCR